MERNEVFYAKYPEDIPRVKEVIRHLSREDIALPSGGNFSVLRFRQLGYYFGFHGSFSESPTPCCTDQHRFHGHGTR